MNKQYALRAMARACVCVMGSAHVLTAFAQSAAPVVAAAPVMDKAKDAAPAASAAPPNNGYAETLRPVRTARAGRGPVPAYTPIQSTGDDGQIAEVEMFVGESRVFPAPGVARIAVGNGSLLNAAALDGKEVILFANAVGTSSLFIWNTDGRYQRVKINIVPGDTSRYAREIAAFLSTIPRTKASIVGANIIVEGDQLADGDLQKVQALAERYPQIVNFTNRVGWEKMVAIDVKVVEFPSNVLREMGVKWNSTGGAALGGLWGPIRRINNGPYQIDARTSGVGNAPPISSADGQPLIIPSSLNVLSLLNVGLNAQLNLLAQEGKAVILSEPQLSTRSGANAKFVAGGEIPYAVQTKDGLIAAFKEYGVKLDIKPMVDPQGGIRSTIKTEVSSVDRSITTPVGPAILTRKTETEFNVRAGETIVLAGLLQRETGTDVDKLPLLGDLPVLGALFRSKRFINKETELVVFVTPTIVTPQSPGMADRVERVTERLQERMGPKPYLSDPLQPGADAARPDLAPPAASSTSSQPQILPTPPAVAPTPLPAAEPKPVVSRSLVEHSGEGALLRVVSAMTVLRAQPAGDAAPLLTLEHGATAVLGAVDAPAGETGAWRSVRVGALSGWVAASDVQPLHMAGAEAAKVDSGKPVRQALPVGVQPRPVTLRPEAAATVASTQQFRVQAQRLALRLTPDVNAGVITTLAHGELVHAVGGTSRGSWVAVSTGADNARWGWVPSQWLTPLAAQ
jgi:pilus assembly protein CpaC